MASQSVFGLKWGIMATGGIANTFTKDLLADPACRDVNDVQHTVAAVASSSSLSRAKEFITDVQAPSATKAYGSYAELVKDPTVDIIYVATPHSHHFQNTMLALEAGKHVLCEKAFTVNAEQARKLVETAKSKKLFLMEAVWTRYFPLSNKIREMVTNRELGKIHRVIADFSNGAATEDGGLDFEDSNRMVNMDLAGGALLDQGIYSLTWVFQILYHTQPKPREAPKVLAAINHYAKTGADESTCIILQFEKQNAMGIALAALNVEVMPDTNREGDVSKSDFDAPSIRIQGQKGEIQVFGPAYRPTRYRVIMLENEPGKVQDVTCPIPKDPKRQGKPGIDGWGHGMFWEADEAARCIRDGKLESETLDWEESILIMDVMDEVRKQGNLKYPELIETTVSDAQSPLNSGKA